MSINVTPGIEVDQDTTDLELNKGEDLVSSNTHCVDLEDVTSIVEGYKKEYSIVGDGLYASVSAEDTPQWLAALIDDVVANAVANGMTDYNLLVQDVRNAIDALDVAKNTYVEQINFDATVDQIIGNRLQTLNATLENTYATIVDLDTVVANTDFALTQRANDLQATFNDELNSRVTNITQAYSDADSSLADDITALESVFEDQESNLAAAATAISGLQTYVGVTESNIPDGTGILSSIALLQKQADGLVETFVGAHELVANDMDGDINTNELRVDQWPYALWVPMEGTTNPTFTTRVAYKDAVAEQYPVPEHTVYKNTSNNTFWEYHPISYGGWEQISENDYNNRLTTVRDSHVGDTYVRYEVVNGVREYVESYKFIKDGIDNTIPYNTDRDGYSWAVVSNTPAEAAYLEALNAYALADGKISQFYAWGGSSAPADYTITNPDGSTEIIPGSNFRYWFLNGVLKYFNGSSWVDVPTNIGSSVHLEEGDLLVVFDPTNRDYTYYVFNGTSWQQNGPEGVISKSKFFVDLENEVTGPNGHVASSLNSLSISSNLYADNVGASVENKFTYGSEITLNGKVYTSGFGLNSTANSGAGTAADPYKSDFWINAERFKFTNSNNTGQVAPFTIDASGTNPQITFNGRVSFNSVTSVPDYTLNSNVGASLTPPFTSWNYIGNFTTTADNIKLTTSAGYPETEQYYPIDSTKAYKVRFRARPRSGCNGLLYFCLRQYVDKGTAGPSNGGRSPYYPSAVTAADNGSDWKTYEYTWLPSVWQTGCKYVRPSFLNNYAGSAGYWEIADFYMFEAADVTDYVAISNDAQSKASTAESNAVSTASSDATSKANTAQTNAINTANTNIATLANANVRSYWAACYSSNNENNITYDTTEQAVRLYSSSDSSIGMCTPAQPIGDSTSFKITVTFKASSSASTGVYFRVQEYDESSMPAGKTHISNGEASSESRVEEDTREIKSFYENSVGPTSWTTKTFTYTPSSSAKFFSFLVLNWTGMSTRSLYIRNVEIVSDAPDISDQLPKVVNSTSTPTSSDVYPAGTIWRYSHTVDISSGSSTQYVHYLSEGGGTWRNIGGTYIDGGNIITGSLNADDIRAGVVASSRLSNDDPSSGYTGTILNGNGLRVYENGVLRVKIGNI